jgi:hypothetical protein
VELLDAVASGDETMLKKFGLVRKSLIKLVQDRVDASITRGSYFSIEEVYVHRNLEKIIYFMAARTTRAREVIIIKISNLYYLVSFDLFSDSDGTFLVRTSVKMDLKGRKFQEISGKIQDFLYNFGVGMFYKAYHVPIAYLNQLFLQDILCFELEFVPEADQVEENFDNSDRSSDLPQMAVENSPVIEEKNHFCAIFKRPLTREYFNDLQNDVAIRYEAKFPNFEVVNQSFISPTFLKKT